MSNGNENGNRTAVLEIQPVKKTNPFGVRRWILVIFLTLPFYALDQLTKRWIVANFDLDSTTLAVIPGWFNIVYVANTGAAFGSFKNSNSFFITISAVTLLALIYFNLRGVFKDRWSQAGASLLAAGILGNLTDRFLYRHVVDFLDFDLHVRFANPWPSFNVADSCICVAVGLFLLGSVFEEKRKNKSCPQT